MRGSGQGTDAPSHIMWTAFIEMDAGIQAAIVLAVVGVITALGIGVAKVIQSGFNLLLQKMDSQLEQSRQNGERISDSRVPRDSEETKP